MAGEPGQVGTKSVLFTDLVGSTELRVSLGEAAADSLRRAHDSLLTSAIRDSGGAVVKGLGDGLMATFDSAADAVAGAVAVQQATEQHRRRTPEHVFAIRVGVSIGDVSREDEDVFGVPVVEAARLCATAAPGEILVADLVRALARGRGEFVFEPMGALALKGLPEPVDACRVIWEPIIEGLGDGAGAQVPVAPALLGAATAYIGREQLRDRLAQSWAAARSGQCRTALLAGEPGVGKTRTAAELARSAFGDGALVLYGRCDEDLAVPYQPFVEALEYYARFVDTPVLGRWPGELRRLVPDLRTGSTVIPAAVSSDPASEEYRLFEAVASWLMGAAAQAPGGALLVLDDIHWATKPTLQLMQHLVRAATDEHAPVMVIATYRDTDIDRTHPLSTVLGDLRRLAGVDRIAVDNLNNAEVVAFITTAAGHDLDEPTTTLAHVIYDETEGNPFFVGEVLRHLIETGAVRREGDRWMVADPDHVAVPEGVRDVVGRRLSRLTQAANDVLSVAAVIGRDFEIEPLMAVVDVGEDAALDALDLAVRARLVEEVSVDRYRFGHALVRTTLYEELSATRRRRLHRRVADALEKLRPRDVRALAYHCTEAGSDGGDSSRALRYTLAAAEESLAARAFADAEIGFRAALDLLEDGETDAPADYVAALCGLGEAQRDQGDPAFRQTLLDASNRAVDLGATALLTRAVLSNTRGYASVIGGVDPERLAFAERAVDMIGAEPSADRARLIGQLASEMTFLGEHERRLALVDEAEQMAREIGDQGLLGDVLVATSYSRSAGADWKRMVERGSESVELADLSGDPARRVIARVFWSSALLAAGRLEQADRVTRDAVEIANSEASPLIQWTAEANMIRVTALEGRLNDADTENNACLARARELDQPDGEQWWAATALGILWLRGLGGNLADATEDFAAQYPLSPIWRTAQAWLLGEAGRLDEIPAVIRTHRLAERDLIVEPWPFVGPFQFALAVWHLNDPVLGAKLVRDLEPFRACWSHYYLLVLGPVSWALGMARAATGAHDAAILDLEDALEQTTRHGHIAYTPTVALHLATVLLRRDAVGDRDRARQLLTRARDGAVQIGAPGVVERIDALLVN